MKSLVLTIVLFCACATPALAHQWKVRDVTIDPAAAESKLMLAVSTTSIQVVRRADDTVLTTINPKDVVSIWYDDKLVDGSLGREWVNAVVQACASSCDDQNLMAPLVMLAVAGAGYLVAEPFSKRQHVVSIRYREGERVEWLTLGINWFDHVWLMEDLSKVTGLKWLNMPLQRTKLFWSVGDHTYDFQSWWATDAYVPAGTYDVVSWEDGKGKGVLMIFAKSDGTPRAVAIEPVVIEGPASSSSPPEYCLDENGKQRLVRISLKKKRLVLPAWDAACRRAREKSP